MRFKAALVQFESALGENGKNLARAVAYIGKAAALGAKFVCFPELFLSGYNMDRLGSRMTELAAAPDGAEVRALCAAAKEAKIHVIAPMAVAVPGQDLLDNASFFISDEGKVLGITNKNHTFGGPEGEGKYFAVHGAYPVYETPYGTIGVMCCYDMNMPESARILALKGAKLIFAPSAWRVQDLDVWNLLIPARAVENVCYVAACNAWQDEPELHIPGHSKAVNPRGVVIAESGCRGEELLTFEADLEQLERFRAEMPYLKHRRPEGYTPLLKQVRKD